MTIPFATVADLARVLPPDQPHGFLGGMLNTEQRNRIAESQNLANQIQQARIAALPALQQKLQIANQLNQLQLQQEPQTFQSLIDLRKLQADMAKKKAELIAQQAGLIPAQQKLLESEAQQELTKSRFTPEQAEKQALHVQKLRNEATLAAAKAKNIALDPFAKTQATQLGKDLNVVGSEANDAQEKTVLFKKIDDAVDKASYTGPSGEMIGWTTPAGQNLGRLLAQAQMGEFAKLHNVRNVREFNKALSTIGTQNQYKSVLKDMVQNHLKKYARSIDKLKFYHNYLENGGKNPQEVEISWLKHSLEPITGNYGEQIVQKLRNKEIAVNDLTPSEKLAVTDYYKKLGAK